MKTKQSLWDNEHDIALYGEKILNIRKELRNMSDVLFMGNYGCYIYNDDDTNDNIVVSQTFPFNTNGIGNSKVYSSLTLYGKKDYDHEKTIDFVTAQILYEWLAKDNNAQQVISDYVTNELREKSEKKGLATESTESKRNKMYNNKKITDNWLIKTASDKNFNFVFLTMWDWIADDKFDFLDLLQNKKEILKIQGERKHNKLKLAFHDYLNLINEIPAMNDKEYVVSTMAIMELEKSFYTTLFLYFAYLDEINRNESKSKNKDKIKRSEYHKILKEEIKGIFWQPFLQKYFAGCLIEEPVPTENRQFDLMCYQDLTRDLLKEYDDEDFYSQFVEYVKTKYLVYRCFANDLLILFKHKHFISNNVQKDSNGMCSVVPDKKDNVPVWTSQDYKYAANFFRKLYPVVEEHPLKLFNDHLVKIDDWSNKLLDFYCKLYKNPMLDRLHEVRQEIRDSKKD